MAKKQKQSVLWFVVAIAVAGVSWYLKQKEEEKEAGGDKDKQEVAQNDHSKKPTHTSTKPEKIVPSKPEKIIPSIKPPSNTRPSVQSGKSDAAEAKLSHVRVTDRKFDVLENCELINHRHNDGDSFHVKHGGKQTEFRLYFVDTPESKYKSYRDGNNNGKRLREQGNAMGGLSQDQTTTVGTAAKKFVLDLLAKQKFRVATQWENVYGPDRKYAFIIVKWEGREVYLHELLTAKGLSRIHTKPMTLPDSTSSSRQRNRLREIEKEAKKLKLGAWAY